jgi:hypothetical protein
MLDPQRKGDASSSFTLQKKDDISTTLVSGNASQISLNPMEERGLETTISFPVHSLASTSSDSNQDLLAKITILTKQVDDLEQQKRECETIFQNEISEYQTRLEKLRESDKIIIEKLKGERNDLQSKCIQVKDGSRTLRSDIYNNRKSALHDNLAIQELKEERNILGNNELKAVADSKFCKRDTYLQTRTLTEDKLIIQQLKDDRKRLQLRLSQSQEREIYEVYRSKLERLRLKDKMIIQQFKEDYDVLQLRLRQTQETQKTNESKPLPERKDGLLKTNVLLHQRNRPPSIEIEAPEAECAITDSTGNKLRLLRFRRNSLETQLKTLVSPANVQTMMVKLQDDLAESRRLIAKQKTELRRANRAFHFQEKKNNHITSMQNDKKRYRKQLDTWKYRVQQDLEPKYLAIMEYYDQQIENIEEEYDIVKALPWVASGMLVLCKIVMILMTWYY